jgi:hypothetical protein
VLAGHGRVATPTPQTPGPPTVVAGLGARRQWPLLCPQQCNTHHSSPPNMEVYCAVIGDEVCVGSDSAWGGCSHWLTPQPPQPHMPVGDAQQGDPWTLQPRIPAAGHVSAQLAAGPVHVRSIPVNPTLHAGMCKPPAAVFGQCCRDLATVSARQRTCLHARVRVCVCHTRFKWRRCVPPVDASKRCLACVRAGHVPSAQQLQPAAARDALPAL